MPVVRLSTASNQRQIRHIMGALVVLFVLIVLLSFVLGFSGRSGASSIGLIGLAVPFTSQSILHTIENATLGFNGVLAINLPERTDHRDGLVLASAVSGIHVDFIPGIHGDTILDKALPANRSSAIEPARKGSWRAHVNAISRVVENGWETALIIEDDVDWDVRLKRQLQDFAVASQYVLSALPNSGLVRLQDAVRAPSPTVSPYGDGWDVLWLGHCGMALPLRDTIAVIHENDQTTPATKHQKSYDVSAESPLEGYPQHTRVVTVQNQGTCSLAYAVSQQGARKLLFALGLRRLDMAFDLMLREWCQGANELQQKSKCISVLPQLFDHHRRVGPSEIDSDISGSNGVFREKAYTLNIRQSVRMNMGKILAGRTDFDDQWPD